MDNQVFWVPQPQVAVGPAATAFTPEGKLADEKVEGRVKALLENLKKDVEKLK